MQSYMEFDMRIFLDSKAVKFRLWDLKTRLE